MQNIFNYSDQMEWKFGKYIEKVVTERGISPNKLAIKMGISPSYIQYLIRGEASGKKAPPNPSIDLLLSLSKALDVPIQNLINAYQGKEPDAKPSPAEPFAPEIQQLAVSLLKAMPKEMIIDAFRATHTQEELDQLIKGKGE